MKNNKGITLMSLVVYLIVLTVLIGTASVFTRQFYSNLSEYVITGDTSENYVRFMAYITKDVNSKSYQSLDVTSDKITFNFKDGSKHSYTYKEESIYFSQIGMSGAEEKKIKICPKVTSTVFSYGDKRLETVISVDDILYKNIFTI